MRTMVLAVALLAVAAAGCQNSTFLLPGKKKPDDYGLLLKSIDAYAKRNGLTREQAIRQLREDADRNAREGHADCCPTASGRTPPNKTGQWARAEGRSRPGTPSPEVVPAGYEAVDPPDAR